MFLYSSFPQLSSDCGTDNMSSCYVYLPCGLELNTFSRLMVNSRINTGYYSVTGVCSRKVCVCLCGTSNGDIYWWNYMCRDNTNNNDYIAQVRLSDKKDNACELILCLSF